MARARSASGRARGQITQIAQDQGEVVQAGADGGVLGPVGGFGDGQGAFGSAGRGEITETAQDPGEGVHVDADVGVLGPVGGFGDGQGAFGQRAGRGEITEIRRITARVVQVRCRRRGARARRRFRRWPGRVRPAGGRRPRSPRSTQDAGEGVQGDADVGVLGPVGGFGDGQGAFGQWQGRGEITETAQDPGEGVQGGADGGVLGPVRGFRDGQGPFGQWPGLPGPALGMQVRCRRGRAASTCPRRRQYRRRPRRG